MSKLKIRTQEIVIVAIIITILLAGVGSYALGKYAGTETGNAIAQEALDETVKAVDRAEMAADAAETWRLRAEEASATVAVFATDLENAERLAAEYRDQLAEATATIATLQKRTTTTTTSRSGSSVTRTNYVEPSVVSGVLQGLGVSAAEIECALWICQRESTFNASAVNVGSHCYGLFQLSAGMADGNPWSDPTWNTTRANKYALGRYGSWAQAKAHWLKNGWY